MKKIIFILSFFAVSALAQAQVLPVTAYGCKILSKKTKPVDKDYTGLDTLIARMWDTMYATDGVGISANQVNVPIRLFVVDATYAAKGAKTEAERKMLEGFKKVIANPEVLSSGKTTCKFYEGCLSLPDLGATVVRPDTIVVRYRDERFRSHTDTLYGFASRVFQHEYDHLQGIVYTDRLSREEQKALKPKLDSIRRGTIAVPYDMIVRNKKLLAPEKSE